MDPKTKRHMEQELLPFLKTESRWDVKSVALHYFLEMTGTKEGLDFIGEGDKFIPAIMALTADSQTDIVKDAYLTLINLSTQENISCKIMKVAHPPLFVFNILKLILSPDFEFADEATSIVSNVTRFPVCAHQLSEEILAADSKVTMESIVNVLCQNDFNKNAKLHKLALILSNLTQVSTIRKIIMDEDRCIVQKLLPFTEYSESVTRRGGIIGTLRNCCFEFDHHKWLLSDDVDILSRLLLPLAGPEEFDDDETEKLPVDLQYLSPEKKREEDPDLRIMLIEAITQLCSTESGRLFVKKNNAYVILRELHKWERSATAKLACQKLCELLISDEPQPGMEELHKVEVPEHLVSKFKELDADLHKDIEEGIEEKEKAEKSMDVKTSEENTN